MVERSNRSATTTCAASRAGRITRCTRSARAARNRNNSATGDISCGNLSATLRAASATGVPPGWRTARYPGRYARPRRAAADRLRLPSSAHWPAAASCTLRSVPTAAPARSPSGRSRAPLLVDAGQQEARPAEQVIVQRHPRPVVPQGERPHLIGAPLVDLERHESTRLEQRPGAREQGPRRREPVYPAHQPLTRLEQSHRGVERRVLHLRKVGRIGYDGAVAL